MQPYSLFFCELCLKTSLKLVSRWLSMTSSYIKCYFKGEDASDLCTCIAKLLHHSLVNHCKSLNLLIMATSIKFLNLILLFLVAPIVFHCSLGRSEKVFSKGFLIVRI